MTLSGLFLGIFSDGEIPWPHHKISPIGAVSAQINSQECGGVGSAQASSPTDHSQLPQPHGASLLSSRSRVIYTTSLFIHLSVTAFNTSYNFVFVIFYYRVNKLFVCTFSSTKMQIFVGRKHACVYVAPCLVNILNAPQIWLISS